MEDARSLEPTTGEGFRVLAPSPRPRWLLLAILVLAAGLRLWHLSFQALWADEAITALAVREETAAILTEVPEWEHTPPLHSLMLRGWTRIAGDSPLALRLPSALLGVAAVAVTYAAAAALGWRTAGLVAALLAALSSFLVWYSQEARTYALLLACATASWALFARLVTRREARIPTLVLYSLATTATLYAHNHGVFVLLAQGMAVVLLGRRVGPLVPRWAAAAAAAILLFVPWMPTLQRQAEIVAGWEWWQPVPRPVHVLWTLYGFFGAARYPVDPAPALVDGADPFFWAATLPATAAVLVLVAVAFLRRRRGEATDGDRVALTVLACWALVPIAAAYTVSQLTTPIFYPRYFVATVPAWLVLASRGWQRLPARPLRAAAALVLLATASAALAAYFRGQGEAWDDAVALVEREGRPGDAVVLASHFLRFPVGYYYDGQLPVYRVHDGDDVAVAAGGLLPVLGSQRRLWLVEAYAGHRTARRALALLVPAGPHRMDRFPGVTVYRYDGAGRPGFGTWAAAASTR